MSAHRRSIGCCCIPGATTPRELRRYVSVGASPRDPAISAAELAAYTAVANMILNMDEVITKG